MTVSIDTTTIKVVRLRIDAPGATRRATRAIFADRALPEIAKRLAGKKPTALGVVTGPGAFSATRTGVALMNALAYAWHVPLTALTKEEFDSSAPVKRGALKPVPVLYGAEPNITMRKKR